VNPACAEEELAAEQSAQVAIEPLFSCRLSQIRFGRDSVIVFSTRISELVERGDLHVHARESCSSM
jgi:hypothetical protein